LVNGGAGLRAAIESHHSGAGTLVIARVILGKAHTTMAESGYNAALDNRDPSDSIASHFRDTVVQGAFLNDKRLGRILEEEAPDPIYDLETFGAVFDRNPEGKIVQRPFEGPIASPHVLCGRRDRPRDDNGLDGGGKEERHTPSGRGSGDQAPFKARGHA